MGTVNNQLPRMELLKDSRVSVFADRISEVAKDCDITYMEALETFKTLALIDDYDTKDEQIAGMYEMISAKK